MIKRLTFCIFCLLIFSLPFVQPINFKIYSLIVQFTELLFIVNFVFFLAGILLKQVSVKFTKLYFILGFYIFALVLSACFSASMVQSFAKLIGVFYLFGLFFLAFNIVNSCEKLKIIVKIWLAATFIVSAIGTVTVLLFYVQRDNYLLNYTLHHYGTLIPGNYPRIQTTFYYPSMVCNYLSISLVFAFIARQFKWINATNFWILFLLVSITLIFTLTPGLGGIALILGIYIWKLYKNKKIFSQFALASGILISVAFFASSIFSPVQTPTSPYYFTVRYLEKRIDPSVRLLTWQSSTEKFIKNPLTGVGIGMPSADVNYRTCIWRNSKTDRCS